jgi:hypothetical protein
MSTPKRFVAKPSIDDPNRLFVEEKIGGRFYIATVASSERLRQLAKCHPYRVIIHNRVVPKPRRKSASRSTGHTSRRINYAARVLTSSSPFSAGMEATARRMDQLKENEVS